MTKKWSKVCKESRVAYPQYYKALRVLKGEYNRGEITDAQYQLKIVKQLQQVIGDRPQARTFWALKKWAARLENVPSSEGLSDPRTSAHE